MREWSHQVLLMFEWHLCRQVDGILQSSPWKALYKNREIAGAPYCRVKGLAMPLAQIGELTHKHKHVILSLKTAALGMMSPTVHHIWMTFVQRGAWPFGKPCPRIAKKEQEAKCGDCTRSTHESNSSIASHGLAFAHFQWYQASKVYVMLDEPSVSCSFTCT